MPAERDAINRYSTHSVHLNFFFTMDLVGLAIEVFGEVTKLPPGRCVFGAVGNIATFSGAFAECVRV